MPILSREISSLIVIAAILGVSASAYAGGSASTRSLLNGGGIGINTSPTTNGLTGGITVNPPTFGSNSGGSIGSSHGQAVPEPTSLLALAGFGVLLRRKK